MTANPRQRNVRIGLADRAAASEVLAAALRDGRIDLPEYDRRAALIHVATMQPELSQVLVDLPHGGGPRHPSMRVSAAEREQALARLADALTDGRQEATRYAETEVMLRRAVTCADIDAVVGGLDAKASLAERSAVVERLDAAAAAGSLDPVEHHVRIAAARAAATDEQLAALVSDLATAPNPRGPSRPGRQPRDMRRVADTERKATDARLRAALDDGRLDLAEFDQRVGAAYAAKVHADLERLVADLPASGGVTAPTDAGPIRRLLTAPPWLILGGAVVAAAVAIWLAAGGRPVLASVVLAPWLLWQFARSLATVRRPGPASLTAADAGAQSHVERGDASTAAQDVAVPEPAVPPRTGGQRPAARQPRQPKRRDRQLTLEGHTKSVTALACLVLPDGTPAAISASEDNTARVWNLVDGSLRHILNGHTGDVVGVGALTLPDATPVAVTVGKDRVARVWDLRDGSSRGRLSMPRHELASVACITLPDGKPAAIVGGSNGAHLCDVNDGALVRRLGKKDTYFKRTAAITVPDGRALAVLVELFDDVAVYDLGTGARLATFTDHTDSIEDAACWVLPDGTPVAVTASYDETAQIWDLDTCSRVRTVTGHTESLHAVACVALPDGTPLAVTGGITEPVQVWDLRDDAVRKRLNTSAYALAGLSLPDRALVVIAEAEVLHVRELR